MDEAISSAYVEGKSIIILGDFNIDLLDKHPHQESWLSVIDNYELSQLIANHTRVTPSKKSLLDHIYVSENILVKYSGVLPWALSDHFPVYVVISNSKLTDNRGAKHMEISYRKTKQLNEELFCNDIVAAMLVNFPNKFCEIENDVNSVANLRTKYFNEINNRHCPTITKRIKRQTQPKWITAEILDILCRRDFEKKVNKHNEYKKFRNKCKLLIKLSKITCYKETIDKCKNGPRELEKCFNELGVKNVNRERISKIKHNEVITENIADIVNLFNYNFVNIGDKYSTILSQTNHTFCPIKLEQFIEKRVPPNNSFEIPLISHQFVYNYIKDMKGNKSTSDDDISARFIKLAGPYITDSIVKICNCSIKTGRLPDTWKVARVTPTHKKDSRDDISNYRSISILPIASKILEKHVSIHLYEYMTSYNLLHQKQSGFRANHSCETALTLMVGTWLSALNRGSESSLLLADLCKAFDLVDNNILIKKLKLYKCSSVALNWFESYLRNRKQFVVINDTKSKPIKYKIRGTPRIDPGPATFYYFHQRYISRKILK